MQTFANLSGNLSSQVLSGETHGNPPAGHLLSGYVKVNTPGALAAVVVTFSWDEAGVNRSQVLSAGLTVGGIVQLPPFAAVVDASAADAYLRVSAVLVGSANYTLHVLDVAN
jgi:hypothetical protein